jgi:hypothetical protein
MPHPTSCAAVVADTIVRTVELGVTITNTPHDAETTVLHYMLDDRRHHRAHVTTGQIVPAGPRCPIWTVLQ